jgi:crossover junction endodeoxyribonuclease RuvC
VKILGIDPGLVKTGFGLIEFVGGLPYFLDSGLIYPKGDSLAERLACICAGMSDLIEQHKPQMAAVEIVFSNINPKSTLLLGQARGAALAGLALAQTPVFEYTALQVKKSVVGYGKADKTQVQTMVQHLLKLKELPQADQADALACAICHAHTSSMSITNNAWKNSETRRVRKGRGLRLASLDDLILASPQSGKPS